MVYRKNNRRQYRRARKPMTRGAIYGRAASQLYSDVKKLKNLINVEFKWHDVHAAHDMHTTGVITPLNFINQGDGSQLRDGDQFRIKSIEIDGRVKLDPVGGPAVCRYLLVIDTDPGGVSFNISDLLHTSAGSPVTSAARNLDNRNRFVILKDFRTTVQPNGREVVPIKYYRKLDLKTLFNNATASFSSLKNHGLYLVTFSDIGSGSNPPDIDVNCRVRYVDN